VDRQIAAFLARLPNLSGPTEAEAAAVARVLSEPPKPVAPSAAGAPPLAPTMPAPWIPRRLPVSVKAVIDAAHKSGRTMAFRAAQDGAEMAAPPTARGSWATGRRGRRASSCGTCCQSSRSCCCTSPLPRHSRTRAFSNGYERKHLGFAHALPRLRRGAPAEAAHFPAVRISEIFLSRRWVEEAWGRPELIRPTGHASGVRRFDSRGLLEPEHLQLRPRAS